jgi:ADP-heptose:LPS heptosyltransferase/predicted nuclease with TOPRIM domain
MIHKNIVILSLDTLGDLTLRQPLFSALLDARHTVTVVVRRGYDRLIPFLDKRLTVIVTNINPYVPPDKGTWNQVDTLSTNIMELEPDLLVSALYNRTWLDEWIMGTCTGMTRVGFDNASLSRSILGSLKLSHPSRAFPSGPFFTGLVTCAGDSHESEKNNALLKFLLGRKLKEYQPILSLPPELLTRVSKLLAEMELESGNYVLGVPAGNANVLAKVWPTKDFKDLVVHLKEKHGLSVLLTGVESESEILDLVVRSLGERGIRIPFWLGSSDDLDVLLGFINNSCFYLGTDTGPMHFAAALGKPVVALFGGGTWPRFLPLAPRSFVATQKLPCFGCNWQCWLNEPKCMTMTDTETFITGIKWTLSSAKNEKRLDPGKKLDPLLEETIHTARKTIDAAHARTEESNTDRASRLEVIKKQGDELGVMTSEKADLEGQLTNLNAQLEDVRHQFEELEGDRASRLEVIKKQGDELGVMTSEKADLEGQLTNLNAQLEDVRHQFEELEGDRASRLEVIKKQGDELGKLEGERNTLLIQLETLSHQLEESEADRAARLEVIKKQGDELGELAGHRNTLLSQVETLSKQFEESTRTIRHLNVQLDIALSWIKDIRSRRLYRIMRISGLLNHLEQTLPDT